MKKSVIINTQLSHNTNDILDMYKYCIKQCITRKLCTCIIK